MEASLGKRCVVAPLVLREPQDERDGTFSVEARLAIGARGVCPTPDPFADLLIPRAEVIVAQDDIIYAA